MDGLETEAKVENKAAKERCDCCKKHWCIILTIFLLVLAGFIAIMTIIEILRGLVDEVEEGICLSQLRELCYVPYVPAILWTIDVDLCYYNNNGTYDEKGFINSGTPQYIDIEFDCTMRKYAYQYGKKIQPRHGSFVDLFDALQLQACDETRPSVSDNDIETTYYFPENNNNSDNLDCIFYVDPIYGNDTDDGISEISPFSTIEAAIDATRNVSNRSETECVINLLEGTFYLSSTIMLTQIDSNLVIQNYKGDQVIISGGIELEFEHVNWTKHKYEKTEWREFPHYNNVYNITAIGSHVRYECFKTDVDCVNLCCYVQSKIGILVQWIHLRTV